MLRGQAARSLAIALAAAAITTIAAAAHAQTLAPAIDRPGSERQTTQPSLRLVTLGGMSLAISDENNEINLWDFAGSSLGLLGDRDSTSLDIFLDSRAASDRHTFGPQDREAVHTRSLNLGMQAVGRSPGKFAAGLDAGYLSSGAQFPVQDDIYIDHSSSIPLGIPTFNGVIGGKIGWGAHLTFANESASDDRRIDNFDGTTVDLDNGELIESRTPFTPNENKTSVNGLGLGLGYYGLKDAQFAVNWDRVKDHVRAQNENPRRVYETEERIKSDEFSIAAILHPSWITAGAQAGKRGYDSNEEYRFSLSGGLNGPPLSSRGDRLTHDLEQKYVRVRVALEPPAIEGLLVGADYNVRYDRLDTAPATGAGNFNDFMDQIATDTLGIVPDVVATRSELRHVNGGLGVGYRVNPRILVGLEGHAYRSAFDGEQTTSKQTIKDIRGGIEFAVSPRWTGRIGGFHRAIDDNTYTENDESVSNAFTAGVGWMKSSRYQMDAGFELGNRSTDYPDPTDLHGSTFRFVLYNRWAF